MSDAGTAMPAGQDLGRPDLQRMGSFYTNVTVTGVDGDRLVEWLRSRQQPVFVEISERGCVVFDAAGEAQDGSHAELAQLLSDVFGCVAVAALNHDEDVLRIDAFSAGVAADAYDSSPGYFDFDAEEILPPVGGHELAGMFGADRSLVEAALRGEYVFAVERHAALLDALRLPVAACGYGYEYLSRGGRPRPSDPTAQLTEVS